jgi:hypothetical protein
MNIERTIETRAVVTPNCAMDSRNQTSSYRMLQKPEMKKNAKNHPTETHLLGKWCSQGNFFGVFHLTCGS